MSFSFTIQAANKAAAKARVAEELQQVVLHQPVHAADKDKVRAAVDAHIDLLAEKPDMDVLVAVSGSVGWMGELDANGQAQTVTAAGMGVNAYYVARA